MFIEYLEEVSKLNEKPSEDDYIKDGLRYCGKCHTPKQTRVMLGGRERIMGMNCKCEAEEYERKKEEERQKELAYKVQRLRKAGFTESRLSSYTFDSDDGSNPELGKLARKYVDNFPKLRSMGKGLLLFGDVGSGKTFMASAIANALIEKGVPCCVTSFTHLSNLEITKRQEFINGMGYFDLLVIDDLAAERNTEYMNEMVYAVIDARYRSGLPLIVTTNLTSDELKNAQDTNKRRIYSRLFDMTYPYEVTGKDRRRQNLRKEYDEMKELLT